MKAMNGESRNDHPVSAAVMSINGINRPAEELIGKEWRRGLGECVMGKVLFSFHLLGSMSRNTERR